MQITPISTPNNHYNNTIFKAKINGIILPASTAEEISKLLNASKVLTGKEIHLLKTQIGSKEAIYNKYLDTFEVGLDSNSSLTINTKKNKIRSIFAIVTDKDKNGQKVVRSFYLYNGGKNVANSNPHINYSEHCAGEPDSCFSIEYEQGDKISRKIGKQITKLLDKVSKQLGI